MHGIDTVKKCVRSYLARDLLLYLEDSLEIHEHLAACSYQRALRTRAKQ